MTVASEVLFFDFGGHRLAYRLIGHGPSVLIAFHGFGQDGRVFCSLNETSDDRFTIVAIDLFFHGHSQYTSDQLLTKTGWQTLMGAFLANRHIHTFSLLGFSLGGRFALALVEAFADRIQQLILIAPDGITRSIWYRLGTTTPLGRWVLRYGLRHLSVLNHVGHALVRMGLLNRTAMRFAELSLSTAAQRKLVYNVWTRFRHIYPDIPGVAALLNHCPVRVRFFTGAFDRIVPGTYIGPLKNCLHHYELTVLKTGHTHLIDLTMRALRK